MIAFIFSTVYHLLSNGGYKEKRRREIKRKLKRLILFHSSDGCQREHLERLSWFGSHDTTLLKEP